MVMKTHYLLQFLYCTALITAVSVTGLRAQDLYKLSGSKENSIKVLGTSNVHDWTMEAQNPTAEALFSTLAGDEDIPKSLNSLSFSVGAKSLKSDRTSMDNRTYKTIKADTYPKITFKLVSSVITPVRKNVFLIKATGTLTIAGTSKTILMQVNGSMNGDNSITCSGQQKIKLTDFNIQPPSFMMGAMKVGDDLTIQYGLTFKKATQNSK
jgi:polyisoprenoid-binding protein YceI